MPLIEGYNFATSSRMQPFVERLRMFYDVLDGLRYAHKNNVLHRDIKPSNIIVRDSDLQPIILDFGQAYLIDDPDFVTLTTTNIGSAGYIPSEVLADPTIRDNKHDIFSCGVILFEIFAGRRPDPMNVQSLEQVDENLKCLDKIIARALAPANDRYPDIEAFLSDINRAYEELGDIG